MRRVGNNTVIEKNVITEGDVFIGHNCVIRSGTIVGDGVVIGHNTVIEENVCIGSGTRIQAMCYITKNTNIEENVFIGPMVCTANDKRIASHGRPIEVKLEGPTICYGARIGARVLLMPGITVGRNALIGAGTVVVSDVPGEEVRYSQLIHHKGKVPKEELI